MINFFEFLEEIDINIDNVRDRIDDLDSDSLHNLILSCRYHIYKSKIEKHLKYDFIANKTLSGSSFPCNSLNCRIRNADYLSRFASLYSDKIIIHDPFQRYFVDHSNNSVRKEDVVNDFKIIFSFKPLLEAGIIEFATSGRCFCESCQNKFIEENDLVNIADEIRSVLNLSFSKDISISINYENENAILEIDGLQSLFEHPMNIEVVVSKIFVKDILGSQVIGNLDDEQLKVLLHNNILGPFNDNIINDLILQNIFTKQYGANYLSNRYVDFNVISAINNQEENILSHALIESFQHSIPCIMNASIERLLDLRFKEGEAFEVYRDSIKQAVKSSLKEDPSKFRDVFNDIVKPELNKIDLTVKNSKKLLTDSIRSDLIFAAGFISVGLYGGFLPPTVAATVGALGGFKYAKDILDKSNRLCSDPHEIRDNKFYFLWKIQNNYKKI